MKTLIGKVVKVSAPLTVRIEIVGFKIHPKYKKRLVRSHNYLAHNELDLAIGDMVKFLEVSPISKMKKWKVIEKVERP